MDFGALQAVEFYLGDATARFRDQFLWDETVTEAEGTILTEARTAIHIYYDGQKVWTYTGVGIPKVQEWLWLSVGASFKDGDFQNGTYPAEALVDYVRVWTSNGN